MTSKISKAKQDRIEQKRAEDAADMRKRLQPELDDRDNQLESEHQKLKDRVRDLEIKDDRRSEIIAQSGFDAATLSTRMNAIEDSMRSLRSDMRSAIYQLESKCTDRPADGSLDNHLSRSLETTNTVVATLSSQMVVLESLATELRSDFNSAISRLDRQDVDLSASSSASINNQGNSINGINRKLATVTARVSTVEKENRDNREDIASFQRAQADIREDVSSLQGAVEDNEEDISTLQEAEDDIKEKLRTAKRRRKSLEARIEELEDQQSKHQTGGAITPQHTNAPSDWAVEHINAHHLAICEIKTVLMTLGGWHQSGGPSMGDAQPSHAPQNGLDTRGGITHGRGRGQPPQQGTNTRGGVIRGRGRGQGRPHGVSCRGAVSRGRGGGQSDPMPRVFNNDDDGADFY